MRSRIFANITTLHVVIGLIILTLLVFGPFATNSFVALDDNYLIYKNTAVQTMTLSNILHVFSTYDPQLYIPLTFVSFQLNALLFGMNATAFHAINLLLHATNAVLVLLIIRRLSGNLFVAGVTAALFAIHPIQTEAVLWASSRKDLLSGFFFLLGTLSYLRYRENDWKKKYLWWSIVFYALGLLAKVSIIMLPMWLLCIDWLQKRPLGKHVVIEKIPYFGLAAIFGVISVIGKSRILQSSGTLLNILLPSKSVAFYLEKFLWPTGLSVIYPYEGQSQQLVSEFALAVGLIAILVVILLILIIRGRHRLPAFLLGTYFLLLVPSFTTFWKNGFLYFASDRYVYLASIGIFGLIALLLYRLKANLERRGLSDVVTVVVGIVIIVLIPFTRMQSAVWKNTEALYRNVLVFYPNSVMALTNLGLELQHQGKLKEAREQYEKAIKLDPHSIHAYFNLASLENDEGHPEAADRLHLQVVDVFGPNQAGGKADLEPLLWLAGRLERMGKPLEAVRLLEKLVGLAPTFPQPHHALGERYRQQGNDIEAFGEFEAAANYGSTEAKTYFYLVEYYSAAGRMPEAIDALEKGVALDPENQEARQKLEEVQNRR